MRLNKPMLFLLAMIAAVAFTAQSIAAPAASERGKAKVSKVQTTDFKIMDINMIDCYVQNNGKIGENPATGGDGFFYPKGQRNTSIIYTSGIWVIGKIDGDIRSACADYATEFQPGKILPDGNADDPTKPEYIVYKYNKGDAIDAAAIDQGCPPTVMGDQMVFSVFNDVCDHSGLFTKPPIGLEAQMTGWGFNRSGTDALGNTLFFKYHFINKNTKPLEETYVAVFFDPDLGQGNDDYVACDTTLGIGYVYNGNVTDQKYGAAVPAMACDFFQGPIVDAPGSTATLPDGTVLQDKKILKMTAFFAYINGSPIAGMTDPTPQDAIGAQEAYFFLQGRLGNGEPWTNTETGQITTFPFDGDPVAGTGWLMSSITVPKDMRMGLSAGPFTLAPGESKDVVIGLVVGAGKSNMSSIGWMKFNDKIAQYAYDQNFDLPSPPPAPVVSAAQIDDGASLTWDDAAVRYDQKGYVFEGYNIWQAAAPGGPWTRITTIDVPNQITQIWDDAYVESVDAIVSMPLQFGKDTGLRYDFTIQKDYITNGPLVNGKQYYFAVTAYAYNLNGVPKILETATNAVSVIPQKQVLDVKYQSTIGDTLPYTRVEGPANDGKLIPIVVDPAKLTGHAYSVSTKMDAESGALLWTLKDKNTGENKLVDQTNLKGDENYLVVDGVKWVVVSPAAGVFNYAKGPYVANGIGYAGFEAKGSRYLTGVSAGGTSFFNGGFIGGDFSANTMSPFDYFDVRIDFWNRTSNTSDPVKYPWSKASVQERPGYAFKGVGTFPGAAYDMTDPAIPRRVNVCFVEQVDSNAPDMFWDPIAADVGDGLGGREYLFVMASNYVEDPSTLYNDVNPGRNADVDIAVWGCRNGEHTSDEEWQAFFFVNHPMKPSNVYEINTAGYSPRKSADIARERLGEINVFPNPYFGGNNAEAENPAHFVTFNNLPEKCTIRIFSLSGKLVRTLLHANGTPIEKWDLLNSSQQPVGWGMFLVHIGTEFGDRTLKMAVINRQQLP
jgi:hypothetical protein